MGELPGDNQWCLTVTSSKRTLFLSVCHLLKTSRLIVFLSLTTGFLCLSHHLQSVSRSGFTFAFLSCICSQSPDSMSSSSFISIDSASCSHDSFPHPSQALISRATVHLSLCMARQLLICSRPGSDPLFWLLLLKEAQRAFYEPPGSLKTFTNSCPCLLPLCPSHPLHVLIDRVITFLKNVACMSVPPLKLYSSPYF